jgi:hypothetical protein
VGIASIIALHLLLKAAQAVGVRLHIETIIFHTTELSEEAEMVFNDALRKDGYWLKPEKNSISYEKLEYLFPAMLDCLSKTVKAAGKNLSYEIIEIK